MTPTLLARTAEKLRPRVSCLGKTALGCIAVGALMLATAVAFPSAHTLLLFLAWPFICGAMASIGLLLVTAMYTAKLPDPNQGILSSLGYHWNRIGRAVGAPFITPWLLSLTVVFLAGVALGVAHLVKWIHPYVAS